MCPIHHDVVDSDPASYTVERLTAIKEAHETAEPNGPDPNDEIVKQLIANIICNTITQGSIIFNNNQWGGQVAHTITNIGAQPQTISGAAANALVADLRSSPAEQADLSSVWGDQEAFQLATILKQLLEAGGWQVKGVSQVSLNGPLSGVLLEVPQARNSISSLGNWMLNAGLKPQGVLNEGRTDVRILVGANLP
jgi:hypothetical protein